jgi:hypothetical protein
MQGRRTASIYPPSATNVEEQDLIERGSPENHFVMATLLLQYACFPGLMLRSGKCPRFQ